MSLKVVIASSDKNVVQKIERAVIPYSPNFSSFDDIVDLLNLLFDKNSRIDFLIIDKELFGLDGISALSIIRRVKPRMPIIFIGKIETFDDDIQLATLGVTARLKKPSNNSKIVTFIENILSVIQLHSNNKRNVNDENQSNSSQFRYV